MDLLYRSILRGLSKSLNLKIISQASGCIKEFSSNKSSIASDDSINCRMISPRYIEIREQEGFREKYNDDCVVHACEREHHRLFQR